MGEAIDRLAKALAAGASRRGALGGLLAGAAGALPWPAAAHRRHKKHTRKFKKYQELCRAWCGSEFDFGSRAFDECVKKAKEGKGPCYSASQQGPGYFCTHVQHCDKGTYCCANVSEGPVTEGACCENGTFCNFLNGTAGFFCLPM